MIIRSPLRRFVSLRVANVASSNDKFPIICEKPSRVFRLFSDPQTVQAVQYQLYLCNGWKVWSHRTTSVPKNVPRLLVDKVRFVSVAFNSSFNFYSKRIAKFYHMVVCHIKPEFRHRKCKTYVCSPPLHRHLIDGMDATFETNIHWYFSMKYWSNWWHTLP